ncbi:MAG: hypothetical protein GY835_20445 [bacterium]|nr:hypothetical protein [bacterium]
MAHRFKMFLLATLLVVLATGSAFAAKGYLKTPDIHGDQIVFTSENDLWICSDEGGDARRLTTHVGDEYYPHFSPDGKWIAFTGQYNGNRDIFVISTSGGEPRRLTWHRATDDCIGWTKDGKKIIFRSWREHPMFNRELFTVPVAGGSVEKLPLGRAGRIDIDNESGQYAFSRTMRERATWKRYRGGSHETIWVGDPTKEDYREVTDFDGTSAFPMWHKGDIFYLCDKGGTYNIWKMDADGSHPKRLTDEGKWDVRFPAMGEDGRITYMLAGGIKVFDPQSRSSKVIEIELPTDRIQTRERFANPNRWMTNGALSPDGERVAVVTRGEIFSVPVEDGVTLPITEGTGARERYVTYHPDGDRVLYLSDHSGEEGYYSADAWGRGKVETELAPVREGYLYSPSWAPDGEWIAYCNNNQELCIVNEDGKIEAIDRGTQRSIRDFEWSPDGRWLAYNKYGDNNFGTIYIYDTDEQEIHQITSNNTDDRSPTWDPDGKYLYFASDRFLNPYYGNRDYNLIEKQNTQLYMMLLQEDGENPFLDTAGIPPLEEDEEEAEETDGEEAEGDEVEAEETEGEGDEENADAETDEEDEDEDALTPVEIDFAGLMSRVIELPTSNGSYDGLGAVSGKLFYFSYEISGRSEDGSPTALMCFDIGGEEASVFVGDVNGYDLAPAANKIAIFSNGSIYVVGTMAPPGPGLFDSQVSLGNIVLELDPTEEWAAIFDFVWRRARDRFWDKDMCGLDWKAIGKQYRDLLPLISNHDELNDLIGELISELNMGHTYVSGGDANARVNGIGTGLLGVDVTREGSAFRLDRIYRGEDADNVFSPLLVPGLNINEGQYVVAVNGRPLYEKRPFCANFENQANNEVMITVADDAAGEDNRRDIIVQPLGIDNSLRYHDWVRRNREYVLEKTEGKMGYIHIPNMSYAGMVAFNTWFYPQLDKEGLVIDVRWNGGGNTSQLILERLRRPITAWDITGNGNLSTYPYATLNGPFVVLLNEEAGSDGDIFPHAVKLEKLAPIIGQRSWGGVVGIDSADPTVDFGMITYPHYAWWDNVLGWDLENHGVDPDIEVVNLPQEEAKGIDSQLDRGIEELLRLHKEHPPLKPTPKDATPNTREYYNRMER